MRYGARAVHSDEELMIAYAAGDTGAFKEIFARYQAALLRVLASQTRSSEVARDLVQLTFLHAHRARRDFDPSQKLRPWLFTIATNLRREHFRRARRKPEVSLESEGAAEPSEGPRGQARADAVRVLRRAMAELSAAQSEVIALHWLAGLSFHEIAEVRGTTLSATKALAHRGYLILRQVLGADPRGSVNSGVAEQPDNQDAITAISQLAEETSE